MKLLLSLTLVMAAAKAEVTIDLAKAVFDEDLGQFCVMQKASFISKCHVHRAYRYRMSNKQILFLILVEESKPKTFFSVKYYSLERNSF